MSAQLWTLVAVLTAAPALANGLLLRADVLPPDAVRRLEAELGAARLAHPAEFRAVTEVYRAANALDASKRGPLAPLSRELKPLGPDALLPMLELIALRVPGESLTDSAAVSLSVGLLEAVGELRDVRARPVLNALLRSKEERPPEVRRAVADAYGALQDDDAAKALIAQLRSEDDGSGALTPSQRALVLGMGSCRRLAVAEALHARALTATREADRLALTDALSNLGNAWAWKTPGVVAKAEERAVRQRAAEALVELFVRADAHGRRAASNALMVVDAQETQSLISRRRSQARGELQASLEELQARLARNPTR